MTIRYLTKLNEAYVLIASLPQGWFCAPHSHSEGSVAMIIDTTILNITEDTYILIYLYFA